MFALGMDFSTLEETERLGGVFSQYGRRRDPVALMAENGVNAARLRLWNDPYSDSGEPYGAGCCDMASLLRLARRAADCGMKLMLDLHYSDFWCDPSRQLPPKAWRGLGLADTAGAVSRFTAAAIDAMTREGLAPEWVQVGNEITNGMLWPLGRLTDPVDGAREGYDGLAALVNAGCRAVRENSDAAVVIHLERSGDGALWRDWLDSMTARGLEFDVLGASYYPCWHGSMAGMRCNLAAMAERYGCDVMVTETAYPFTAAHFPGEGPLARAVVDSCPGAPYPCSPEGQRAFTAALLETVRALPGGRGKGVFYWEPAWLPLKGSGWATEAARRYIGEEEKPGGNEWANQCLFDFEGRANPALAEFKKFENSFPALCAKE